MIYQYVRMTYKSSYKISYPDGVSYDNLVNNNWKKNNAFNTLFYNIEQPGNRNEESYADTVRPAFLWRILW